MKLNNEQKTILLPIIIGGIYILKYETLIEVVGLELSSSIDSNRVICVNIHTGERTLEKGKNLKLVSLAYTNLNFETTQSGYNLFTSIERKPIHDKRTHHTVK